MSTDQGPIAGGQMCIGHHHPRYFHNGHFHKDNCICVFIYLVHRLDMASDKLAFLTKTVPPPLVFDVKSSGKLRFTKKSSEKICCEKFTEKNPL